MNQDLTNLKAQAYDLIARIEEATRLLNQINAAIAQAQQPEPEPEPKPAEAEAQTDEK